jgi:hypothetical protein
MDVGTGPLGDSSVLADIRENVRDGTGSLGDSGSLAVPVLRFAALDAHEFIG